MHEIPPRGSEVGLLGSVPEEVAEAQRALVERGYRVPDEACFMVPDATLDSLIHDRTRAVCGCDPSTSAHGLGHDRSELSQWIEAGTASLRLWIPSPLLDQKIEQIETLLAQHQAVRFCLVSIVVRMGY